jgi:two-component system NtrC family response regulator
LLRFIQERVIERIGGRVEIPIDVRIVCATNQDLEQMISHKMFREDLYFRLSDLVIDIPPLKDRGGDKLLLSRHFLSLMASKYNRGIINFDETAIAAIDAYDWPGNVRELMNRARTAVVVAEGKFITSQDLGLEASNELALNLKHIREGAERTAILTALAATEGKIAAASRLLGVTRPTLYDLLNRHGIAKGNCDIQLREHSANHDPYERTG